MTTATPTDGMWTDLSVRGSAAAHKSIGWMFWDPDAIRLYAELGVPDGVGYYIASRAAPIAPAGDDAVIAAFFSIHAGFIRHALALARRHTTWAEIIAARDAAVEIGLQRYVPEVRAPLAAMADELWSVVDALEPGGRVLFAAHRGVRPSESALAAAWNALNCIREWRGDSHWAIVVAHGLDGVTAGLLHDAWMGYPGEWIPRSRGADDDAVRAAMAELERRGLAADGRVNSTGIELREEIEQTTNRTAETPWRLLGEERTRHLLAILEPYVDRLLVRVDETAGENYMPAVRPKRR